MHDGRTRLARDVEREVRTHFPQLVFETVIPRNVRIGEAPELRAPGHPPRSALPGIGRLLRAGEGSCCAALTHARPAVALKSGGCHRDGRTGHERVEMSAGPRGMGRGLAAILAVSDEPATEDGDLRHIPLELIAPNPRQPRRSFDQDTLQALADSVRERGIVQPVLVRPVAGGTYELVAGERRWRAAQIAGMESVPGARPPARRQRGARDRAHREHGPGGPQPRRGGARLRGPRRGARASRARTSAAASAAAASRCRTSCGSSTCPTRSLGLLEARRADRGPRPRAAARRGPRRPPPPRARGRPRGLDGPRHGGEGARGQRRPGAAPGAARRGGVHPDQAAAATEVGEALARALGFEVRVRPTAGGGLRAELDVRGRRAGPRARRATVAGQAADGAVRARYPPHSLGRLAQSVRALL